MEKRYYFLGICGISMSSLAIMLKNQGFSVSGNDKNDGLTLKILEKNGIKVDKKINRRAIKDADVVVYSSAIKEDEKQLVYAKKCKKKIVPRGEILGQVSRNYKKVVAIAGSHGKTTTTGLIYEILRCAGKKPTLHLGGFRIENEKNYIIGENEFFVTEACEYHDNFLFLKPYISVVTNVEKEHMDYFKTFENQCKSFEKFKKNSQIVIEDEGDLKAKNISHDPDGGLIFDLCDKDGISMHLHMKICEEVNIQNVIYAYQVAKKLAISDIDIKNGLENFLGVKTRFERVNCPYFDIVVCDYAHHPTEIAKTIETASKIFCDRKVITIFQPHTFSRTKSLLSEFIDVFKNVEMPIFFKTYSARENKSDGVSAFELCKLLRIRGINAKYFANFKSLKDFLIKFDKKSVLVFIGAGDLPNILNKNDFIS